MRHWFRSDHNPPDSIGESSDDTGCLKKKGICFMISISVKLKTNLLDVYLTLKVGSIAVSGIQKHFCTISGSRGMSKQCEVSDFKNLK